MNPRVRRIVIPLVIAAAAVGLVVLAVSTPKRTTPSRQQPAEQVERPADTGRADVPAQIADATTDAGDAEPQAQSPEAAVALEAFTALRAVAPAGGVSGHDTPPASIGSLDPNVAPLEMQFSRVGASVQRITLSGHWQIARARRQADAHYQAIAAGRPPPEVPPLPPDEQRYVLQHEQKIGGVIIPAFAADAIDVNGSSVSVFDYTRDEAGDKVYVWSETAPGRFETEVVDGDGRPVLRITRHFSLSDSGDIILEQRITNLTEGPLDVGWLQYGPGDLAPDRARYMDRRRFRFGYLLSPKADPSRRLVLSKELLLERTSVEKRNEAAKEHLDQAQQLAAQAAGAIDPRMMEDLLEQREQVLRDRGELLTLWPNDGSRDNGWELSWFATTNRYFGLAIHPLLGGEGRGPWALGGVVARIEEQPSDFKDKSSNIFTYLYSPRLRIAPGETADLSLGIYAGPLDRDILRDREPFASLHMQGLIIYQMSSLCAICTFQWLAHGLLWFLSTVHGAVNDWGLAIIILVVLVRILLHPLTKKAQVSMQRFGKAMSDLKPEIDKLKNKYADQPKKLQQEQMKLMRERGANPVQMLGCLPMFLQMPIWVALYAALYFAIELRHEPAFWGVFQLFGDWPFLADLSAADHFFGEFDEPFYFLMWNMTGINFLPALMGLVFFFQQKYMSPPPSPSMTKEQLQQQKIMKVMMVVMFPVMLYSAPSGLTLYIFTSSAFGIIEGRYIRRHIKELDLAPPKRGSHNTPKAKRKPRDPQGRAFADAVERAKAKRKPPPKTFKKRR